MSSPNAHRIASPATNRLGSPSARIGSPRAEHSRLTASSQQRPGSLLLPSSTAAPGISLTSLASDNIVASVESLNEEENNRPPPTMSSTSQAAWKSLASTSLVLEPPSKPKKSALLSRIFSKPPTPKASEASKTATEPESIGGETVPSEEQEDEKQPKNDEEEQEAGKVLPKRAHKLLPQRTQAVLDQTVDPKNHDGIEDAKTAEVTNVHLTAKARKRDGVGAKATVGEKEKVKKGKKRKEAEKKKKLDEEEEEEVDEARIQRELKKRRKAAGSRRSSADFVKPKRSQSRQVNNNKNHSNQVNSIFAQILSKKPLLQQLPLIQFPKLQYTPFFIWSNFDLLSFCTHSVLSIFLIICSNFKGELQILLCGFCP